MRILQAMAGAKHGGAETYFMKLIPALQRAGVQQLVVIRKDKDRAAALRSSGIEPVEVPFGGALDFITPYVFKREIRGFKPHVVMTWMNRATRFCPKGDFVHVGRLGGYYDLKYYQDCDHLIANTEDIRDYLIVEGWPEEKAHYLPNFAEARHAAPVSRSAHFTPDMGYVVLALGRLHPNKAFDVLLKAMVYVPDAYLWLAGDGPLKGHLEDLAEKIGIKPRVRFLGWREDVPALMAACDVFVCPSRHEPLGNVILEAWAQGVPVVAADSIGPGRLIRHLETGLLVPVDDEDGLSRAIRYLLEEDEVRARIAQGGRAAFEAEYTEAIVIRRYIDFFEASMSEKQT